MQTTQQEFKAGDVLKCIEGYNQDHRVMFLKQSSKRPYNFHGVVVVGNSSVPIGCFSKRFYTDCFELAASATPAPSGKLEEAESVLREFCEAYAVTVKVLRESYSGLSSQLQNRLDALMLKAGDLLRATGNEASESALPEKSEVMGLPIVWQYRITLENVSEVNQLLGRHWKHAEPNAHKSVNGWLVLNEDGDYVIRSYYSNDYVSLDDPTFKAQVLKQKQ